MRQACLCSILRELWIWMLNMKGGNGGWKIEDRNREVGVSKHGEELELSAVEERRRCAAKNAAAGVEVEVEVQGSWIGSCGCGFGARRLASRACHVWGIGFHLEYSGKDRDLCVGEVALVVPGWSGGDHGWRRFREDGTIIEKITTRGLRNSLQKVVWFPMFTFRNACHRWFDEMQVVGLAGPGW